MKNGIVGRLEKKDWKNKHPNVTEKGQTGPQKPAMDTREKRNRIVARIGW